MLEKYTLKKQFTLTFTLVLICSVISVLIILVLYFEIIDINMYFQPANYYEKQIPNIAKYVEDKRSEILEITSKDNLEKIIPIEGMEYRVMDNDSNTVYGNLDEKIVISKKMMINYLNGNIHRDNKIIRLIPILDKSDALKGVIALQYQLKVTTKKDFNVLIFTITIILILSPFLFIILFTLIFGKQLSKRINRPLEQLIKASKKIKYQDLDFKLHYPYNNELGQLTQSFESMRCELKKTLNEQWRIEKEKKDMVSALSHDLRTPLTVIKGRVELLQEGSFKKQDRLLRDLKVIDGSVDRAILLVNDLNMLSKLENVDFNLNIKKVKSTFFLNEKFDEYLTLIKNNNIKLNIDSNLPEEDEFSFDELRISQALDNIITNSVKYIDADGTISIKILKEHEKLRFIISDTGKGFSKEDLRYALTKFYRGDKARSNDKGSLGLGLYITKTIVNKHNGELSIYNNECGGAVVDFYIAENKNINIK